MKTGYSLTQPKQLEIRAKFKLAHIGQQEMPVRHMGEVVRNGLIAAILGQSYK